MHLTSVLSGPPLARVLQLVHQRREVPRAELTRELGLSRTAVGVLVSELQQLGLVRTGEPDRGRRGPGRPSPVVGIDPAGPVALAAQVHQSRLRLATVGLGSQIISLEVADVDPADLAAVRACLRRWIRQQTHVHAGRMLVGVGVAVSAPVRRDGFVHSAPYLGWEPIDLRAALARDTRRQVAIEVGNDANLAALGEYRHGAGAGATTLLCLLAEEVGVGGGLVHHGELFTGSAGFGLEAGHLQVNPRGRRCICGARGCLQVQCDSQALLRAARRPVPASNPAAAAMLVLDAARAGDDRSQAAVDQITGWLATGLTGLVNLLDPDRIALVGLHRELARMRGDQLLDRIRSDALVAQATEIELVPGTLGEPVLIGAAERVFEPLLRNPRRARAT
jgi:predicted NBD/HSP70 family sugar kinase/biotin operon repressor